jgi:hypothetical protein
MHLCVCVRLDAGGSRAMVVQIVNGGVCLVVSANIPNPDRPGEWIELIFVGVAGEWHYLPPDALKSGKLAAGYAGISLAVLSIVQAIYGAGRRLSRSS